MACAGIPGAYAGVWHGCKGFAGVSDGQAAFCNLHTCRLTCGCSAAAERVRQLCCCLVSTLALSPLMQLCAVQDTATFQTPLNPCVLSAVQDPVIFSGTVRANLDPFDTAGGDANIWQALQQAGMAATIKDMKVSGAGLGSLHLLWCAVLCKCTVWLP